MASIAANLSTRDREQAAREAWRQGILGSLAVVSAVLAARLILLISIVGAFALAWVGVSAPDPWRAAIFAGYAVVVVLPLVWLASRR